jgi:hypothetical protein
MAKKKNTENEVDTETKTAVKKDLLASLKSAGSLKGEILSKSKYARDGEDTPTPYPLINFAFSGNFKKGFQRGITVFAGKSKNFKTLYILNCIKAFQEKHADSVCIFYDNEFGAKASYFTKVGIDMDRVIHIPFTTVEEIKRDFTQKLSTLSEKDNVVVAIDSLGNVASQKEVADALEGNDKQDMTRAKQLKSLGRLITPKLHVLDIPCFAANHTYMTQENYAREIMSGGSGIEYSSDSIFFISKAKGEDDSEGDREGYYFKLKAYKSRFIKEESVFPIYVTYKEGIMKYSGIFDFALEGGFITESKHPEGTPKAGKTKKGYYSLKGKESEMAVRKKEMINNPEYMEALLDNKDFQEYMTSRFKMD